jgi:hypothetical protein
MSNLNDYTCFIEARYFEPIYSHEGVLIGYQSKIDDVIYLPEVGFEMINKAVRFLHRELNKLDQLGDAIAYADDQ